MMAGNMSRVKFLLTLLIIINFCLFSMGLPLSEAAVGDGKIVYGVSGNNTPQARDYTNSTSGFGSPGNTNADETVINWVVTKANPQVNEYISVVSTTTSTKLWVHRNDGTSWYLDTSDATPTAATFKNFNFCYEQNSGEGLLVFSQGVSTDNQELGYYTYNPTTSTWTGPNLISLSLASSVGTVECIDMASRPNSDEIALAWTDDGNDSSAAIWSGSDWGNEPSTELDTTCNTGNYTKIAVAYEKDGDVLVVWGNTVADLQYATFAGSPARSWTSSTNTNFNNTPVVVALCSEPGSNRIGFASLTGSTTSADTEFAIWDGSAWGNISTDADATAASNTYDESIACGWVGTSGKLVVVYNDYETTDRQMDWYSWTSAGGWVVGTDVDLGSTTAQERHIEIDNFPAENKIMVTIINSISDLWALKYDGTTWTVLNGGAALETNLSTATYGCSGIALTSFDPTLVDLINFRAESQEGNAIISWRTASEVRTRGFKLYRTYLPQKPDSYEEITHKIIAARGNPFSGRKYQYIDKDPPIGTYYILEEVLKNGEVKRYGPVRLNDTSTFIGQKTQEEDKYFLRRDGKIEFKDNVFSRRINLSSSGIKIHYPTTDILTPIKLEVNQEGIYRVSAQDIVNAGWDISTLDPRNMAIFDKAKEVPIYVFGEQDKIFDPTDYIEFYAEPNSTRYSATNIYWLRLLNQQGLRMGENTFQTQKAITDYATTNVRSEENESYYPEFQGDRHWFFSQEFFSSSTADFQISLDHIADVQENAILKVNLQGASQMGFDKSHNRQRAIIYLNSNLIGEAEWNGDEEFTFSEEIPLSLLVEGVNTLTIEAPDEGGSLEQFFLLDSLEITYPRELYATADKAVFDAAESTVRSRAMRSATFKIYGFNSSDIKGFAINGGNVTRLNNLTIVQEAGGDYSVTFSDAQPSRKHYIILTENSIASPLNIYPDTPSTLKSSDNQADYIIISHSSFLNAVGTLADYRRSQGLTVKVVDVQDIYDEFNYGIFSPIAIKNFLDYANRYWQSPKPTFVLLVGDGTFDYRDFWQLGQENLVPAYLVYSPDFGETVSDNWLVDFDNDKMPEMFIGRLPVNNETQLNSIIGKILTYESQDPDANWTKELLFVADNEKPFEDTSDYLAGILPGNYQAQKLYLSQSTPEETRQAIIDGINQGRLVFNYVGHAGITMLSSSQIFRNTDVGSLNNDTALPVVLAQDCLTGYFIYPEGADALSEVMLTTDDKGAVACVTPSSLSSVPEQKLFSAGFYKAIFQDSEYVLGALHFKAQNYLDENKSLVGSENKINNIIQTYNLLGDPALILRKSGAPAGYSLSLLLHLQNLLSQ